MNLKRSRKSNSVSFAAGPDLRQVKLFSSEDCPVAIGVKYQNHLQRKASYMLRSVPIEHDFPPGFERPVPVSQPKVERPLITQIQWKCPSKFVVNDAWQVAAGEESEEVKAQKLRVMRVLEANYPRASAIPPNPSVSLDVKAERYDNSLTPLVPLIPIEETEESQKPSSDMELDSDVCQPPASGNPNASKCNPPQQIAGDQPSLGNLPSQNADVTAAASVALTAILKSTEKGSLIDTDLLIKILNDPKMIQRLINEPGSLTNAGVAPSNSFTAPMPKTTIPSVPSSLPKSDMLTTAGGNFFPMAGTVGLGTALNAIPLQPGNVQMSGLNRPAPSPPVSVPQSNFGMLPRLPNQIQAQPLTLGAITYPSRAPSPALLVKDTPLPPAKNMNYYKNLIMQHGVEKQEIQDPFIAKKQIGNEFNLFKDMKMVQNIKPGEVKPKNLKQCKYFKGSNGCRNGVNCKFQHDMPFQLGNGSLMGAHIAKRVKPNGVNILRI